MVINFCTYIQWLFTFSTQFDLINGTPLKHCERMRERKKIIEIYIYIYIYMYEENNL